MRIDKNTKIYLGQTEIVKIKKGNVVIWESEPAVEPEYFYMENTSQENGTLNLYVDESNEGGSISSNDYTTSLEYSRDKTNWTTLDLSTTGNHNLTFDAGDKIYFRNDNGKFNIFNTNTGEYHQIQFLTDKACSTGGELVTLADYQNTETFEINKTGMFYNLFYGNLGLKDASDLTLPSTTYNRCYTHMFDGCTALTSAPALPATTLADYCYNSMFYDCFSLTSAPALPATTLADYCYMYMFQGCHSLTTAPALPATTLADSCYSVMFSNCISLVNAPALPATTLTGGCYTNMFTGCTSLTTAPALPATTLADYCYNGMFYGCTALTTAPVLPATTLAGECYEEMFRNCTSLTTAPILPATTLIDGCYKNMFRNCTSLTSAPALIATTMTNDCYGYMFSGCTSLNKILVYADSINSSGVEDWLSNVAASGTLYNGGSAVYTTDSPSGIPTGWSEVTAPALSSISVSPNTFTAKSWMDKPKVSYSITGQNGLGIDIPLGDVSTTYNIGVNTGSSSRTVSETVTYDNVSTTLSIVQSANDTDEPDYFYVETIDSNNVVNVNNYKYSYYTVSDLTPTIEYSTDKVNWNVITIDWTNTGLQQTISLNNVGDKVYFRNDTGLFSKAENNSSRYRYIYFTFGQNKRVNVGGDLRSLLDYYDVNNANITKDGMFQALFSPDNYSGVSNTMKIVDASSLVLPATTTPYCYYNMFRGCSSLVNAPALPATTLASNCYEYMFSGCSSLTTAPTLPATTLANYCYRFMFSGCSSLVNPPALPATTLENGCYYKMFQNCSSLTTAPALPATTLTSSCYGYMFSGCSALTSAPTLPATTLAQSCYQYMFSSCSALTTAPALPATTLEERCYEYMFQNCSSLTTAPVLSATTLANYCCYHMFDGCTALTTAPALPTTTLAQYCYSYMFQNCSSLVNVPTLPATTLVQSCYSNMFNGCTALTTAPVLPATTLATYCYSSMFKGCTSLTTAPALPATTLVSNCYPNMFQDCTALTTAPALPATTLAIYCYSNMFNGCTALTTAPALPATTLTTGCYNYMFKGCSSLNSVTTFAQDISASLCLSNWLQDVSSTGTFNNYGFITYPSGNSGIPTGWTEVFPTIQSIVADPDTFTMKSYQTKVTCASTLTITTTGGATVTKTNLVTLTVGENTGDSTRTLTETIPYESSSYQVTIVQTANDPAPAWSWDVVSTGTYPFELNLNDYYESTNKGHDNSYSYAILNYSGFDNLVLECINYGENKYDYGIISQPDVLLSESITDDGATGSTNVFKNFKQESSATPVQLTIPSDKGSHFITIKFRKDQSTAAGNDSLQFKVIEPTT